MNLLRPTLIACWASSLVVLAISASLSAEKVTESFRAILELTGVGPSELAKLGDGTDISKKDWPTLWRVFDRMEQFRNLQPTDSHAAFPGTWLAHREKSLGELFEIEGWITSVEKIQPSARNAEQQDSKAIYKCGFSFLISMESIPAKTTILASQIPNGWEKRKKLEEHVRLRGVLGQLSEHEGIWHLLFLTDHISWYPLSDVPAGQLLLAQHGMDIALLDEVRHRQPFVKPEISREGEAFYAALTALEKTDPSEIEHLAKTDLPRVVEKWRSEQPALKRKHLDLEASLATATDPTAREELQQKIKQAKSRRALAATVVKQGEAGQSSVAPMFLQPEEEVGELFVFDGTARRAVWIASPEQTNLDGYYELEVYPNESRLLNNQPVVCCVRSLPSGFPTGDEIRVPVRIAGVFFKSWRYRSRNLQAPAGQTGEQRQLYTPIVLSNSPQWLQPTASQNNSGALWGGIAFLVALVALWISMAWLARRDRAKRATLRPRETIDL